MTPTNWDHVDHQITREVLEQKSVDEDSICQALTFANQCLQADQHNEDVTDKMYTSRANALSEAEESWNLHGDTEETIVELRRFWSV
jgi:hypothetical protein